MAQPTEPEEVTAAQAMERATRQAHETAARVGLLSELRAITDKMRQTDHLAPAFRKYLRGEL